MNALAGLLGLCVLLVASCARHVVVEREGGRIDTARSVMTRGDGAWKIDREPSATTSAAETDDPLEEQAAEQEAVR